MKNYIKRNFILLIYFIIHPIIIYLLSDDKMKITIMLILSILVIVINYLMQLKKEPLFIVKSKVLYCVIISSINSIVSALLIYVVRVIALSIGSIDTNSFLMDLEWTSLFLLGGFLEMFIFNILAYAVVSLFNRPKVNVD